MGGGACGAQVWCVRMRAPREIIMSYTRALVNSRVHDWSHNLLNSDQVAGTILDSGWRSSGTVPANEPPL